MKRIIAIAFFFFFLGGVALAQDSAPKKSNEGWEQVNGDMMQPGESIPASRLVGGAYGFICAAVVVWVFTVARRARRLEDEVDELKKKLAARG
ncbi:MAG TPA: hypothetical protein VN947_25255 [Polyangia bacterium]|nr:hypothetical protein [Polyangia bacterium]